MTSLSPSSAPSAHEGTLLLWLWTDLLHQPATYGRPTGSDFSSLKSTRLCSFFQLFPTPGWGRFSSKRFSPSLLPERSFHPRRSTAGPLPGYWIAAAPWRYGNGAWILWLLQTRLITHAVRGGSSDRAALHLIASKTYCAVAWTHRAFDAPHGRALRVVHTHSRHITALNGACHSSGHFRHLLFGVIACDVWISNWRSGLTSTRRSLSVKAVL